MNSVILYSVLCILNALARVIHPNSEESTQVLTIPTMFTLNRFTVPVKKVVHRLNKGIIVPSLVTFKSSCLLDYNRETNPGITWHEVSTFWFECGLKQSCSFTGGMDYRVRSRDASPVYEMCVRAPSQSNDVFSEIMKTMPNKMISFWTDLTLTPSIIIDNPHQPVGEVTFGGSNPSLFIKDTEVYFNLQNLFDSKHEPPGWITQQPVAILVEGKPGGALRRIAFEISSPDTILPIDVYNAVIGPIKPFLKNPLTRKQNVPKEVIETIADYIGPQVASNSFPCDIAAKISGLKLNSLRIPKHYLYDRVDASECILRVLPGSSNQVTMGYHLIKRFHFQVHFDEIYGSNAIFSKRSGDSNGDTCTIL